MLHGLLSFGLLSIISISLSLFVAHGDRCPLSNYLRLKLSTFFGGEHPVLEVFAELAELRKLSALRALDTAGQNLHI